MMTVAAVKAAASDFLVGDRLCIRVLIIVAVRQPVMDVRSLCGQATATSCCGFNHPATQSPERTWEKSPAQSDQGDTLLELGDGTTITADSAYLRHASEVLSTALACSSQAEGADCPCSGQCSPAPKRARAMLRLPLPGTSRRQALLLLHCLYAWDRKAWACSLGPPELLELARVSHKYDCTAVLQLADSALVTFGQPQGAGPGVQPAWLHVRWAPAQLQLADSLDLAGVRWLVGGFLGRHAEEVALDQVENACVAAVLDGARCARQELAQTSKAPVRPTNVVQRQATAAASAVQLAAAARNVGPLYDSSESESDFSDED